MNLQQMKYYKQQKGYSYVQLSELSGVPLGTIQKIFRGETKTPRYDTLQALEKVLNPQEEIGNIGETRALYGVEKEGYTLDDYYALPDEQRVELIDGVFYDMAAPSLGHQAVSMELAYMIRDFIGKRVGDCRVFASPVDVQLDCDDKTMVQPDIVIVCDKRKLTNRCIMGAPDFVLEILSSSTRGKDMFLKLAKYQNAGVREYWMVDEQRGRVITYFFEEDDIPVIYGLNDKVPVKIYNGKLEVDFSKIWQFQDM